jgi:hypothetical protein
MTMRGFQTVFCAIALFGLIGAASAGEATELRAYTVADEGLLNLLVPKHWSDKRSKLAIDLPRTLHFTAPDAGEFEVLLSARWSGRRDPEVVQPDFVLSVVAFGAKAAAPQTEERQIEVQRLATTSGEAYLFSAVDREPKAGEYRYMTQGAVNVQGLICTFTILTNDAESPAIGDAIEMVRTASFLSN